MQELIKLIDAQRKGKENSPVWMVGQQLLDLAAGEPKIIELLKHDLEIPEMDLVHAEQQIKAWADKNKKGNCCCVSPMVADGILRKFYGLPARGEKPAEPTPPANSFINIGDFL
jgi:hypothetical protein